jgi:CheY-like chemotaxis protein
MNKKVLIIDDDTFYCRVYQNELGSGGVKVSCVKNGKEGLEAAKKDSPDLILLDIIMPDFDGYWFLEQRKNDPDLMRIPVIVNSGLASYKDIEKIMGLGADRFFSKLTLSPDGFSKRIMEFLSGTQPNWQGSNLVDISSIKEGQKLNDIFVLAAEAITKALGKLIGRDIEVGNLQATVAPIKPLKGYLDEFMEKEKESIVVYSVLKPPVAAALLLIPNSALTGIVDILEKNSNQEVKMSGAIKEIYSVIANTFLNTITQTFHSLKPFMLRPPMMSTPDLAISVLRNDGFITEKAVAHFLFRQQYILGQEKMSFDFILFLQEEGLKEMGGGLKINE